jgi:hypothetical protein
VRQRRGAEFLFVLAYIRGSGPGFSEVSGSIPQTALEAGLFASLIRVFNAGGTHFLGVAF